MDRGCLHSVENSLNLAFCFGCVFLMFKLFEPVFELVRAVVLNVQQVFSRCFILLRIYPVLCEVDSLNLAVQQVTGQSATEALVHVSSGGVSGMSIRCSCSAYAADHGLEPTHPEA